MRYLIDSDTGLDDALALIHELPQHSTDVVGITTVFGNASLDDCTAHALDIVELLGLDLPVVAGASGPLIHGTGPAPQVHGDHGRGSLPQASPSRLVTPGFAAEFILEQARNLGRDLVIVAMGRLTNIALAIRMEPDTMASIGRIYWMGGSIAVSGNVAPTVEANVGGDPEAAAIVCGADVPLSILPLDATMEALVSDALVAGLDERGRPAIAHLRRIWPYYVDFYESFLGVRTAAAHCGLLLSIAFDRSLIIEAIVAPVAVELNGSLTRGQLIVDRRAHRRLVDLPALVEGAEIILRADIVTYLSRVARELAGSQTA